MDNIQFISLIVTILVSVFGSAFIVYKEIRTFEKDIRDDIKQQQVRTDKLYEMFCELRKEFNEKFNIIQKESADRWYDLMKETKKVT